MRTVALGEACEIVSGATPKSGVADYWDGDIAWVTPADLSGLEGPYIGTTSRTLTTAGLASCSTRILPSGSVLLSSRAPIGHVAINSIPMATNQGFKSLVPRPELLDAKYLYHWLRFKKELLRSLGNGATFKELSKTTVERIQVPAPQLSEQRRAAEVLDRAEDVTAKYRTAAAFLDELLDASYRKEFGHPLANPHRWPVQAIEKCGIVSTGKTPPTMVASHFDGTVPFLTPGDLESGSPPVRTLTESGAQSSRTVRGGSTLVCCIGATIGKVGTAKERSAFNQQINAVEWGAMIDDAYGLMTLRMMKSLLVRLGTSTTLPLLPKSKFGRIEIPVPPIEQQRSFARTHRQVEEISSRLGAQMHVQASLFRSLQARAFSGQL